MAAPLPTTTPPARDWPPTASGVPAGGVSWTCDRRMILISGTT